ncbi:putative protein TPRXL [Homarus americanus]|uniref:putative protein TPRXL n=1 Tax=Homarus americanus TaxID=6706 RepID=UPI001C4895B0|nr:putative protein TPRXL [Homarus americanus]
MHGRSTLSSLRHKPLPPSNRLHQSHFPIKHLHQKQPPSKATSPSSHTIKATLHQATSPSSHFSINYFPIKAFPSKPFPIKTASIKTLSPHHPLPHQSPSPINAPIKASFPHQSHSHQATLLKVHSPTKPTPPHQSRSPTKATSHQNHSSNKLSIKPFSTKIHSHQNHFSTKPLLVALPSKPLSWSATIHFSQSPPTKSRSPIKPLLPPKSLPTNHFPQSHPTQLLSHQPLLHQSHSTNHFSPQSHFLINTLLSPPHQPFSHQSHSHQSRSPIKATLHQSSHKPLLPPKSLPTKATSPTKATPHQSHFPHH